MGSRSKGGLVAKLVWRVKLVAELQPGVTTETEVARIERDEEASLAELGLRLAEASSSRRRCRLRSCRHRWRGWASIVAHA